MKLKKMNRQITKNSNNPIATIIIIICGLLNFSALLSSAANSRSGLDDITIVVPRRDDFGPANSEGFAARRSPPGSYIAHSHFRNDTPTRLTAAHPFPWG